MNNSESDSQFEKLRKAGHGAIIRFDPTGSGQQVEGVIFKPSPEQRPSGYEDGIFVMVPSDADHVYYLDPEASRQEGRMIIQVHEVSPQKPTLAQNPEELLKEFEYLRKAADIKIGGGAIGEACSKDKGIVELG